MSITINEIKDDSGEIQAKVITIDTPESWGRFRQLVARATNVWDRAHPEIKEFADLVTSNVILQDYYSQAGIDKPGSNTLKVGD